MTGSNCKECFRTFCALCLTTAMVTVMAVAENYGILAPIITEGPSQHVLASPGKSEELHCRATGHPKPSYLWYKNGNMLDVDGGVYKWKYPDNNGDLIVDTSRELTQGHYQCLAVNDAGTSISNISFLQMTYMKTLYEGRRPPTYHFKTSSGIPLVVPCNNTRSFPPAAYQWFKSSKCYGRGSQGKRIRQDKRIVINDNGDLIFAYATKEEEGSCFRCQVVNARQGRAITSNVVTISVTESPYNNTRIPTLLYSSENPVVALLNQDLKLKCLFSGRPAPDVVWARESGPLPENRTTKSEYGHELMVRNVQYGDEGYYTCIGVNNLGRSTETRINVRVKAQPALVTRPESLNLTGDVAVFTCKAVGTPEPRIQWYLNEKLLEDTKAEWSLSEKDSVLTLKDLKTNDSMTVHCNASNQYGYELAAVYLQVLKMPPTTTTSTTTTTTTTPTTTTTTTTTVRPTTTTLTSTTTTSTTTPVPTTDVTTELVKDGVAGSTNHTNGTLNVGSSTKNNTTNLAKDCNTPPCPTNRTAHGQSPSTTTTKGVVKQITEKVNKGKPESKTEGVTYAIDDVTDSLPVLQPSPRQSTKSPTGGYKSTSSYPSSSNKNSAEVLNPASRGGGPLNTNDQVLNIGIPVGVVLLVVIVAIILLLFFCCRRKQIKPPKDKERGLAEQELDHFRQERASDHDGHESDNDSGYDDYPPHKRRKELIEQPPPEMDIDIMV